MLQVTGHSEHSTCKGKQGGSRLDTGTQASFHFFKPPKSYTLPKKPVGNCVHSLHTRVLYNISIVSQGLVHHRGWSVQRYCTSNGLLFISF